MAPTGPQTPAPSARTRGCYVFPNSSRKSPLPGLRFAEIPGPRAVPISDSLELRAHPTFLDPLQIHLSSHPGKVSFLLRRPEDPGGASPSLHWVTSRAEQPRDLPGALWLRDIHTSLLGRQLLITGAPVCEKHHGQVLEPRDLDLQAAPCGRHCYSPLTSSERRRD